jgi:hypothetical protein
VTILERTNNVYIILFSLNKNGNEIVSLLCSRVQSLCILYGRRLPSTQQMKV